jgi:hypothetical protein
MSDDQFRKDTEESLALLNSTEWRHYVKFLERRVVNFQLKVNEAVGKGNLGDAQVSLALLRDSEKLARSFRQQVLENKAKLNPEDRQ